MVIDLLQEIQTIIQREAAMLTAAAIGDLKRSFRGALLEPTDAGCDAARKVWNGMIDKRPVENKMWR